MKNDLIELIKKNCGDLDVEQVVELVNKIYGLLSMAKSPIRKRLNKFDKNGNSKVIKGISKKDLVKVNLIVIHIKYRMAE